MSKKKPNSLSAAEIQAEDNYNMVGDGIINNSSKPSMLERLEEFERRKQERHNDDRIEDKRERHKADFHENHDYR